MAMRKWFERVSPSALQEIDRALRDYEAEVDASDLAESTKWTYKRHASTFVRWLHGKFKPGGNIR